MQLGTQSLQIPSCLGFAKERPSLILNLELAEECKTHRDCRGSPPTSAVPEPRANTSAPRRLWVLCGAQQPPGAASCPLRVTGRPWAAVPKLGRHSPLTCCSKLRMTATAWCKIRSFVWGLSLFRWSCTIRPNSLNASLMSRTRRRSRALLAIRLSFSRSAFCSGVRSSSSLLLGDKKEHLIF